jgi:hypothetical protein
MLLSKTLLLYLNYNMLTYIKMYFRQNGKPIERYNGPKTVENFAFEGKKFPSWILYLIIALIIAIGLFFLFKLRNSNKGQKFGYRFY